MGCWYSIHWIQQYLQRSILTPSRKFTNSKLVFVLCFFCSYIHLWTQYRPWVSGMLGVVWNMLLEGFYVFMQEKMLLCLKTRSLVRPYPNPCIKCVVRTSQLTVWYTHCYSDTLEHLYLHSLATPHVAWEWVDCLMIYLLLLRCPWSIH